MKAIVYTSNTGFTKEYALLLQEATMLEIFSLQEAKTRLNPKDEVIYLGWVFAGKIKGLNKARSRYKLKAVGAVGMGEYSDEYEKMILNGNSLSQENSFYLQGGFDFAKLKGINRFIMGMMANSMKKKTDLNAEDQAFMSMYEKRTSYVSRDNLGPLIAFLENEQQ